MSKGGVWNQPLHRSPWAGGFLVIGGIGLCIGGVWWASKAKTFLDAAERIPGTVIELRRERGARGIKLDHPVVRFTVPVSGRAVTFKSRIGLRPSPFAVGDSVTVAYDPVDPEEAKIASFWTNWLPTVVLLLFGLMCVIAGLLTLRWIRQKAVY